MFRTIRYSALICCLVASSLVHAQRTARVRRQPLVVPVQTFDFDDLPAGQVLEHAYSTSGFGPIVVRGYNPFFGPGPNAALIFDSNQPTGGDWDLGTPHMSFGGPGFGAGGAAGPYRNDEPKGKVLIIAENLNDWDGDGLVNSPDDLNAAASPNATLLFDFELIGPMTVAGITIIDVEQTELPPLVTYFDADGGTIGAAALPATGDNGVAEVELGDVAGVHAMMIQMRGSGAVDELRLRAEGTGDISFVSNLLGVDVTPDGSTALLFDQGSTDGDTYFYDTATHALELKTTVGPPFRDFPTGISATERISAHHGDPVQAGLWTESGGWLDLGNVFPMGCGPDQGSAFDVSADGTTAVGLLWDECFAVAFRWTQATGLQPLELLGEGFSGNPPSNRATKIADDGSLIGGFAQTAIVDRWPALWAPDGSGFLLPSGMFPEDAPGEVLSVSADGSMVAGIWNLEGFYWTETAGVVPLGLPPGAFFGQTFPNAIAADDRLIFGKFSAGFFDPPQVFVWTAAAGMRSLTSIAVAHGITIPDGVVLDNVLAASTDGTLIVGTASDFLFRPSAFVLRLPVSAYGL